jgi:hypothetical protein
MSANKWTSIRLRKSTAKRLNDIGRKGESYDDLVVWLLDNSKRRKLKPEIETSEAANMEVGGTEPAPECPEENSQS